MPEVADVPGSIRRMRVAECAVGADGAGWPGGLEPVPWWAGVVPAREARGHRPAGVVRHTGVMSADKIAVPARPQVPGVGR
ncbi:hypothetical protein GCM10010106_10380 [Thermopolyspora flexuosa]|jgi:hypothetical protein|uniref:Uncharacterized protein n=1 Tax=Thermopolyspora flexuosa TaxID=103836 RepID=A0A543J0D8_9ACTN|nr:hypothetical protein FHX40_3024 [Thermopolyspora flexuosa]GGM66275.1 hypothetical protein GCM10010106_10380 [Thermopolyspora flexuosa]